MVGRLDLIRSMLGHPLSRLIITLYIMSLRTEFSPKLMSNGVWQNIPMSSPRFEEIKRHMLCLIRMIEKFPSPNLIPLVKLVEKREIALISSSHACKCEVLNDRTKIVVGSPIMIILGLGTIIVANVFDNIFQPQTEMQVSGCSQTYEVQRKDNFTC